MLKVRVIPTLLVREVNIVKGPGFDSWRAVGSPMQAVKVFNRRDVDELVILDINATLKPHFAIVDGIVGMDGDGPIMGDPKKVGVLVMGRNLPAVDATCCRIMGIDPYKVPYLERADNWLGPIGESSKAARNQRRASAGRRTQAE